MRTLSILLVGASLVSLSSCYTSFGKRSVANIATFPQEGCVASTLADLPGVTQVEGVHRDIKDVKLLLPRRTDTRQSEYAQFSYRDFPFSISSSVTLGREGKATIDGVAGGQCPPAGLLATYEEMIEIVAPAVSEVCFGGAAFKRKSTRKCDP